MSKPKWKPKFIGLVPYPTFTSGYIRDTARAGKNGVPTKNVFTFGISQTFDPDNPPPLELWEAALTKSAEHFGTLVYQTGKWFKAGSGLTSGWEMPVSLINPNEAEEA